MFVYATAYDVFQHFACYNCKGDGSVVGCTRLVPFLKYWDHICFFPFWWYYALIYWGLEKCCEHWCNDRCKFSEKLCWYEVWACCLVTLCTFSFDRSLNTQFFCDLYWSHCRVRAWSFIWYCALILISVENRWELFVQNTVFAFFLNKSVLFRDSSLTLNLMTPSFLVSGVGQSGFSFV